MHGSLKLTLAALLAFASSASASCFEAVRYGDSVATPSKSGPLKYGDVRDHHTPSSALVLPVYARRRR
jgi:hypothetical protein